MTKSYKFWGIISEGYLTGQIKINGKNIFDWIVPSKTKAQKIAQDLTKDGSGIYQAVQITLTYQVPSKTKAQKVEKCANCGHPIKKHPSMCESTFK